MVLSSIIGKKCWGEAYSFPVALPNLLLGVNPKYPKYLCGSWRDLAVFFPVFLVLIRLSRSLDAWTVNGQ